MVMSMDKLYENAHAFYEAEDNYSNRTIVAVIKDETYPETENKFVWGVMYVEDDPDPEADPEDTEVLARMLKDIIYDEIKEAALKAIFQIRTPEELPPGVKPGRG